MEFADNLKRLRKEKSITQEELSSKIYVSRSLIAKYENGTCYPTKENLEKLALYFGVSINELIGQEETTGIVMELDKGHRNLILVVTVILLSYAVIYSILLFLPVFQGYKYEYPIPSGQTQPNRVTFWKSIFSVNVENANFIVVVAFIISLACIALSIFTLFKLNWKKGIYIRTINYLLFVVLLFLSIISIITCLSYIS